MDVIILLFAIALLVGVITGILSLRRSARVPSLGESEAAAQPRELVHLSRAPEIDDAL